MSQRSREQLSRRDVLTGLGAALGAAALGCGGSDVDADDPDASAGGVDASRIDASAPDANPAALCNQPAELSPVELLAHIDTFVVLCMENRSFDHYLGSLSLIEGRSDIVGLTGNESNPTSNGAQAGIYQLDTFTPGDPPHSWDECHAQWNNGANDGFVREYGDNAEAMGYYVREQLPQLYALADGGAVCNHWYAPILGPTWPTRYYLHGADAHGRTTNAVPIANFQNIFELLDDAGISNTNYFHDVAWATGGYFKFSGNQGVENFFEQAKNGSLPQYSLIDPKFVGAGANDDHPEHDVRLGQALIGSVVAALAQSPHWNRCMFVLTYDEHGGFFDHVPPPTTVDEREEFRQLGIRVPSLVVGPTVRRGCAIDAVFEHTSVISTLTERFGLPVINDRVAATNDLSQCIDPALIDDPQPPPVLPPVNVSWRDIENWPKVDAHPDIDQAMERVRRSGRLSTAQLRELDRRDRDLEVTRAWLAHAERLGAVRLGD